ncbi:unnamed protein product [Amoebophrya sp. A120]|nr:unnamed protein product [Amoebophrya sp. A120]|eukprot:GSA120T00004703001.1
MQSLEEVNKMTKPTSTASLLTGSSLAASSSRSLRERCPTLCISGFGTRGSSFNGVYEWRNSAGNYKKQNGNYEITPVSNVGWIAHTSDGGQRNPLFKESGGNTVDLAVTNVPPTKSWTHLGTGTKYHIESQCCHLGDSLLDSVFNGGTGTLDGSSGDVGATVFVYSMFVLSLVAIVGCFCCIKRSKVHKNNYWLAFLPGLGRFEPYFRFKKKTFELDAGIKRHKVISPRELEETVETVEKAIREGQLPQQQVVINVLSPAKQQQLQQQGVLSAGQSINLPDQSPGAASLRSKRSLSVDTAGNQTNRSSIFSPEAPGSVPRQPYPLPDTLDQIGVMHQTASPNKFVHYEDFSPGPWECELCGYRNPGQCTNCHACHRVRGYVPRRAHRKSDKNKFQTVDQMVKQTQRAMKKAQPEIFGSVDDATTDDTRSVVSLDSLNDGLNSVDGRTNQTTRGTSFYVDKPSPLKTRPKETTDANWDGSMERPNADATGFKWFHPKGTKFDGKFKDRTDEEHRKEIKKQLEKNGGKALSPTALAQLEKNSPQAKRALQYWDQLMQGTYPGPDPPPLDEQFANKVLSQVTQDKNEQKVPKVTRDMRTRERMLHDYVESPEKKQQARSPSKGDNGATAETTTSNKKSKKKKSLSVKEQHIKSLQFFENPEVEAAEKEMLENQSPKSTANMGGMNFSPKEDLYKDSEEVAALRRAGFSKDAVRQFQEREEVYEQKRLDGQIQRKVPANMFDKNVYNESTSPVKRKLNQPEMNVNEKMLANQKKVTSQLIQKYTSNENMATSFVQETETLQNPERESYKKWNKSSLMSRWLPGVGSNKKNAAQPPPPPPVPGRDEGDKRSRSRSTSKENNNGLTLPLQGENNNQYYDVGDGNANAAAYQQPRTEQIVAAIEEKEGGFHLPYSPEMEKLKQQNQQQTMHKPKNLHNPPPLPGMQQFSDNSREPPRKVTTGTNFFPPNMHESNRWQNNKDMLQLQKDRGQLQDPVNKQSASSALRPTEADSRDDLINFSRPDPPGKKLTKVAEQGAALETQEIREQHERQQQPPNTVPTPSPAKNNARGNTRIITDPNLQPMLPRMDDLISDLKVKKEMEQAGETLKTQKDNNKPQPRTASKTSNSSTSAQNLQPPAVLPPSGGNNNQLYDYSSSDDEKYNKLPSAASKNQSQQKSSFFGRLFGGGGSAAKPQPGGAGAQNSSRWAVDQQQQDGKSSKKYEQKEPTSKSKRWLQPSPLKKPNVLQEHDPHENAFTYETDSGTLVTNVMDIHSVSDDNYGGDHSGGGRQEQDRNNYDAASTLTGKVSAANSGSVDTTKNDRISRDDSPAKPQPSFWDRMLKSTRTKGKIIAETEHKSVVKKSALKKDSKETGGKQVKINSKIERVPTQRDDSPMAAGGAGAPGTNNNQKGTAPKNKAAQRFLVPSVGSSAGRGGFDRAKTNLNSNMNELQAFLRQEKALHK